MNVPLTPIRFLRYACEQFPSKLAIVCDDQRFTYEQFGDRVGKLAGAIRSLGASDGDRIAFLSTNCHRLLEAYYGVLEAGCVLLPLNVRLSAQELVYILDDSGAKILFFESRLLPLVEVIRRELPSKVVFVCMDKPATSSWMHPEYYEQLLSGAQRIERDIMSVDENSLAELFYTSGTSDKPKGVMLTHRNVYLHALSVIIAAQVSPKTAGQNSCESVVLHTIPLFHANGWGHAHSITLVGGTHVMIHTFTTTQVFDLIQRERVRSCALVPTMATALVNCPERPKYDLSSLQTITIGGAASSSTLVREVEEKLGCVCFSGYGLTETAPVLTTSAIKPAMSWSEDERHVNQARTGFSIPGVELRVIDGNGNEVPHDGKSMGEIVARGDGVMKGYWRQPSATDEVMEDRWFHTGDVATVDGDNYVLIVDRKKDIIISGGENISSLEVEKTLTAHPGVYEVVVIPVPDGVWGEVPKAIVVLKPGAQVSETELIDFCRARLAHYKCPRSVEFMESLPKTGTGKLLKRELRKKFWPSPDSVAG